MTRTTTLIAAALATTFAASSFAQAQTPGLNSIEKRQAYQLDLIREGRRTGSLTFFEGWKLKREQRRISRFISEYLADGRLTRSERRELRNAQKRAGRHIWQERTDAQVRGFFWRAFY